MTRFTPDDTRFMRHALALAARGLGRVEPNPMVGCVIVQDGAIVGEGFHRRCGGPHAEIEALARCHDSSRGATAYVTLEPCAHFGKTPPCVDALVRAGIARVIAAMTDPNPLVNGRGVRRLRAAGVRVDIGLLRDQAARLNAPFIKRVTTGRPWVILKWAQSADGKISTRTGDSKWISGREARRHAHEVRGRVDAVLVGVETVIRDNPELTCRHSRPRRAAARIVLDTRLRIRANAKLVTTAQRTPTRIFCGPEAPARKRRFLESRGVRVATVGVARGQVRLDAVLDALGAAGVTNLLVEGGGRVLGAFFDQHLADEVQIYTAPILIGGQMATGALHGAGVDHIARAAQLDVVSTQTLGDVLFTRALLR